MELKYKGKTAIVTGASGGMGIEVTKELLKRKIKILMLDVKNPPKPRKRTASITAEA